MAWSGARLESGSEQQMELGPEAPSEAWMEPQHGGAFVGRNKLTVRAHFSGAEVGHHGGVLPS
jgi:hypothetical protein